MSATGDGAGVRALILQHGDWGPPGLLAEWLDERGIPYDLHRTYTGEPMPDPRDYAFVATLGSNRNPNDTHDPAVAALGPGHGHLDAVDLEHAGVGRLPAPAGKERAPVEDDTVLLDPGDQGIKARQVGVVLVQRLGHGDHPFLKDRKLAGHTRIER